MTEHIQVVPDKCRACRRCEVACIAAHHGMSFKEAMKHRDELVSRVQVVKAEGFKTTVRCHQCDHAPCANVCPTGALQQDADGRIKLPPLDNHGIGTVFEELIRRFNEDNNEEAGEHFTPRDVVQLMAKLLFLPVAERIESSTYSLYDGSCGTGGMLTVAEESLYELAEQHGKEVSIHLFGQEISDETYAICKADLLLKGEGEGAENIVGGADKSTLSADQFRSREFDFMISNPPYGKSWKTDLDRMGGKKEFNDPRFIVSHAGNNEFKLLTRSSDGQLMFQVNKLQKMKHNTPLGSRIALVHNGSGRPSLQHLLHPGLRQKPAGGERLQARPGLRIGDIDVFRQFEPVHEYLDHDFGLGRRVDGSQLLHREAVHEGELGQRCRRGQRGRNGVLRRRFRKRKTAIGLLDHSHFDAGGCLDPFQVRMKPALGVGVGGLHHPVVVESNPVGHRLFLLHHHSMAT